MARWSVGLQHGAEVQQLDPPLALIGHLKGQLLGIGGQAESDGSASAGERQGVHPPVQTIGDHRQPSAAALGDHGQVSGIPAQGWRTVGLVTPQLGQGGYGAVAETTQLHGGSAAAFADHSKPLAVTAEGWILLTSIRECSACPLAASTAATQNEADEPTQQQQRWAFQSSKRELLSRGLLD